MITAAKKNTIRLWTPDEVEKAIELRLAGQSWAAIASELGRDKSTVRHKIAPAIRKQMPIMDPLDGRPGYESRDTIADMDWEAILNDIEDCRERGRLVHYGVRSLDLALETLIVLTPSERRGFIQRAADKINELERRGSY
jgi:hypothetical protein